MPRSRGAGEDKGMRSEEKRGESSRGYEGDGERERPKDRSRRDRDRDRHDDERKERRRDRVRDGDRERSRSRERRREKKRRERDRDAGSRSPESSERRKRKEAKALAKADARRQTEMDQSRAVAELSLYTGADNPFHDVNIGEQFVWKKKQEKEKKAGLTAEEISRKDHRRRLEAKEELERLNKRRADRETEIQLREEEETKMRRLAEEASMREWIAKEDDFQLEQARRRAGIRLREQRAKAIDFLAINLRFADPGGKGRHTTAIASLANPRKTEVEREEEEEGWGWADAGFEFEIDEPWRIFDNLNLEDCEELEQDIRMYISLEKSPINIEFWEAMLQICEHHLSQLRDPDHAEGGRYYDREVDVSAGNIVSGLSLHRLIELENRTNAMLRSGQPVDGEFWDLVLKKIHVEKSVAKLNSIHEVVLKNRLEQFKKRQRDEAAKQQKELGEKMAAQREADAFGGDMHAEGVEAEEDEDEMGDEDDVVEDYHRDMSPETVDVRAIAPEDRRLQVISEADFRRAVFAARRSVASSSFVPRHDASTELQTQGSRGITNQSVSRPSAADLEAEAIYREEAEREKRDLGSDESEEEFGDLDEGLDLAPAAANYDWSDRYRPRKPRFFNRVQTGFEWNQYNQTHYDSENPPPKVVQGYKFNVFYPDLIDKTKAPTYYIKRIPGDDDTQLIVFTAGPPYEDIAFRIVRHPWEYSHRKGFRSTFDRGVLQLYFNFGRSFYKK